MPRLSLELSECPLIASTLPRETSIVHGDAEMRWGVSSLTCKQPVLSHLPHLGHLVREWIESGLASDHRRRFVCDRFYHIVSHKLQTRWEYN